MPLPFESEVRAAMQAAPLVEDEPVSAEKVAYLEQFSSSQAPSGNHYADASLPALDRKAMAEAFPFSVMLSNMDEIAAAHQTFLTLSEMPPEAVAHHMRFFDTQRQHEEGHMKAIQHFGAAAVHPTLDITRSQNQDGNEVYNWQLFVNASKLAMPVLGRLAITIRPTPSPGDARDAWAMGYEPTPGGYGEYMILAHNRAFPDRTLPVPERLENANPETLDGIMDWHDSDARTAYGREHEQAFLRYLREHRDTLPSRWGDA